MAEGDELAHSFGGHDAAHFGAGEHVALGRADFLSSPGWPGPAPTTASAMATRLLGILSPHPPWLRCPGRPDVKNVRSILRPPEVMIFANPNDDDVMGFLAHTACGGCRKQWGAGQRSPIRSQRSPTSHSAATRARGCCQGESRLKNAGARSRRSLLPFANAGRGLPERFQP